MNDGQNDCKNKHRREFLKITALAVVASSVGTCGPNCNRRKRPEDILRDYYIHNDTKRTILPQEYITYLKSSVFTHGELDSLPKSAVILHDCKAEEHLRRLGFSETDWKGLQTGTTDPNLMYIVRRSHGPDFILNRGLPGAGGIATQAAELYALGVNHIVHIGTCGLIGTRLEEGRIILSDGAYKDAAAIMLSEILPGRDISSLDLVAHPSEELTSGLEIRLGNAGTFSRSVGFTIPIYYFQPEGLIAAVNDPQFYSPSPGYVEMEQASLFQTAALMHKHAASMVVGADRYVVKDEEVNHEFYDVDCDAAKSDMLDVAIRTIG
jgi:purine-nucleoside phosphorylase